VKPALVEKRWLAVFVVTCKLGIAGGLDIFQLHVDRVVSCLCSLINRTIARRSLIGGLYVSIGELTF